jgi:hypothetical protein
MIAVQIDMTDLQKIFSKIPDAIVRSVAKEMKNQVTEVQREARKTHRFETHTGMLEKSVQTEILDNGLTGEIYLEDSIADYGVYVHEGHGSWKPDQFLDEALKKREPEIRDRMEHAIKEGLREAGA